MVLTTKYGVGDKVYYFNVDEETIKYVIINTVRAEAEAGFDDDEKYKVDGNDNFIYGSSLFPTITKAGKALLQLL